ncbi:MAG: beta-ketoacyl synthase N-terminal-like domain-containing protein [Thermodesulfobacteriota bacterium]
MIVEISGIGQIPGSFIRQKRNAGETHEDLNRMPKSEFKNRLDPPYPRFSRMDEYGKIGMSAAASALRDAGLDRWEQKRNIGIIVVTCSGCIVTDIDYFHTVIQKTGGPSSPHLFAYTLPSTFLGDISIHFGLTGPSFVIQENPPRGLIGLCLASDHLMEGGSDAMLVGLCDTSFTDLIDSGVSNRLYTVFIVIKKTLHPSPKSYGVMEIKGMEDIRIKGKKIKDLSELVHLSLPSSRNQSDSRSIG